MTIPHGLHATAQRVSEMVREMVPQWRNRLSPDEQRIALYLRGNDNLYEGLKNLIGSRLEGRARIQEPSDPVLCKSMIARDRELQWLLSRLEVIHRSSVTQPTEESGEQPA